MKKAVVALGGNAISPPGEIDSITNQFKHTRKSLDAIINLLQQGILPVITHGNGPQVGNAAMRTEITSDLTPYIPLGINVADTEGGMGYMIEQSLQNRLRTEQIDRDVVTIVTQVEVSADDPSIEDPSKYIGPALSEEEAHNGAKRFGWQIKPFEKGLWRRVVASPQPIGIVNARVIQSLVDAGNIVIAAGGGGVPVYRDERGNLEGLDAVIDKDKASALLAEEIQAETLYILTAVPFVALNYGTPDQEDIEHLTAGEARRLLKEGQFPPGSMGPKIEAAIRFLEGGGKQVIITSLDAVRKDTTGASGTILTL